MKLYTGPISLFSAKVRIALDEKGLVPDEHVSVDWSPAHRYLPHHPDVVRLNPRRQVPILIDGDVVLRESTVICEYLDEVHPEPPLLPRTPAARARCRTLEAFADHVFFPPLWDQIEEAFYPAAEGGRNDQRLAAARQRLAELYAEIDGELDGRSYLCDDFTVADIANIVMITAAATMGAPPDPALANLGAWLARTVARPAVAREVAGMQAYVASLQTPESAAS
jgi:glutathione S-transferase